MILFVPRSVVYVALVAVSCLYGCPFERRAIVIEAPDVADTEIVSTLDLGIPEGTAQDSVALVDQARPEDIVDVPMLCEAPLVRCGDRCVNPTNDNDNCGGCARTCITSNTCVNGRCTTIAPPSATRAGAPCTRTGMGGADPVACGTDLVCIATETTPMCSLNCTNSASQKQERAMCGGGESTCVAFGDAPLIETLCTRACSPTAPSGSAAACRAGFVCTGWWLSHENARPDSPGCWPFCVRDSDCPEGRRCNVRFGSCNVRLPDMTALPDGSPCDPTVMMLVPEEGARRNVQCRGLCFPTSTAVRTQGICGSYVNTTVTTTCLDDPTQIELARAPGLDNIGLCWLRYCSRNADCRAPLICRFNEDERGVPLDEGPRFCMYRTASQLFGTP